MASNCETMLSKIKIPLPDLLNVVLALDASAMDIDEVENLIKICESKREMETLKNCAGTDKEILGKYEEVYAELMKVPRIEAKLQAFCFRIAFDAKVEELVSWLNTITAATKEMWESEKLYKIMHTIATQENLRVSDDARDCLVKLSDNMALMHDLCKLVGESMPELLDFGNELSHMEDASKIELKTVYESMVALTRGLEKVDEELVASENDGEISAGFWNVVNDFLGAASARSRWVNKLYTETGKFLDSYLSVIPAHTGFEEVTSTLAHFMKTFIKAREEIERQAEAEKKIPEKDASNKAKTSEEPILDP